MRPMRGKALTALVVGLVVAAGACSNSSESTTDDSTGASSTATAADNTATAGDGTVTAGPATSGMTPGTAPTQSAGIERTTVTVDDPTVGPLTFDVRTAGPESAVADGRTVIFLHGFPETSASWEPVMADVAEAGYRAIGFDQRGYSAGARPGAVSDYAVTHLVDDVFGVADALGIDRFHVVGHDWGSVVAWSTAGRDPERVESLTAVSVGHPLAFAGAKAVAGSDQAERSGYMDFFRTADSQDQLLADDAALYRRLFTGSRLSDAELDEYLSVLGTPAALGAALNWYRAMDEVSPDSAARIQVPTLLIWSTGDVALGRDQAVNSEQYVDGPYTYVELPELSHWIPAQAPDAVVEHLLPHLAQA